MTVHYTEGPARAVVRGETVVVLPGQADDSLLTELWTELADASDGVAAALGVLTSVPGGLRAVPPFAVVSVQSTGAAHVAVRGSGVDVTVTTAGGPVQVTGQDVVSWSERVIEEPVSFVVGAAGAATAASDGGLPVESAVVPAASVRRVLVADAFIGEATGLPEAAASASDTPVDVRGIPEAPATPPIPPPPAMSSPYPVSSPPPAPTEPVGSPSPSFAVPVEPPPSGDALLNSEMPPDSPVLEATQIGGDSEYEHLFGHTIMRSVEDAAVRAPEEDEEEDEGSAASTPGTGPIPASDPAPGAGPEPMAAPVPPVETVAPPAAAEPAIGGVPGVPALISEIPGGFPGSAPAAPEETPAGADHAAFEDGTGTGGDTTEAEEPDDHDGHTVMQADLAALRGPGAEAPAPPAPESQPLSGGVQILAVTCPNGHANPPARSACRTCGDTLSGEPAAAARPPLGRLVVAAGSAQEGATGARGEQVVQLDRGVIVGRRPRTSTTSASEIPRLVTVSSPHQDISRSHLAISLEEWQVLVEDLATTNGTMLIRPGQPPRRLHPNEKEIVSDGDVVDLGDGVTLRFEGIW